jgi:hypothetical protein
MIKIYKIWSEKGDKIYVGSTSKRYMATRKADHLSSYRRDKAKQCCSKILFDEYGVENCIFEVIEECEKDKRYDREKYWIETLNTINRFKNLTLTKEEKKTYKAGWHQQQLHGENREAYLEKRRITQLKFYETHKETIQCECGFSYSIHHKARHLKTQRHLSNV